MLEIDKLEREWRRYRLKRIKPWIFSSIALLFIAAAAIWVSESGYYRSLKESGGVEEMNITVQNAPAPAETPSNLGPASVPVEKESMTKSEKAIENEAEDTAAKIEPAEPKVKKRTKEQVRSAEAEESEVTLNPDTDFLESLSTSDGNMRPAKEYAAIKPVKEEVVSKSINREKSSASKKSDDIQKETKKGPEKSGGSGLQILSTKTNNTLQLLIERFNRNNDPKLASYIAQSYYKKGNYKEAVRWSVTANSLDPAGEESWITFARAKVKLGERDEAIKALRVYLNQYSSRKVRSYLRRLEAKK